jgi:hypothetical protein
VNVGRAKFANYSMDVMFEGRNVARLSDPMLMNGVMLKNPWIMPS